MRIGLTTPGEGDYDMTSWYHMGASAYLTLFSLCAILQGLYDPISLNVDTSHFDSEAGHRRTVMGYREYGRVDGMLGVSTWNSPTDTTAAMCRA